MSYRYLLELECLSALELRSSIEADPTAVHRVLEYVRDRGTRATRVTDAVLAAAAGVHDGAVWRKWVRSGKFPLPAKRAIIWAAWGEPAR